MRAVILAGGKGTRLKPYTITLPKPLVPVGGELPVLEIVIRQLARAGFDRITLAVNHMANLVMAFFGDGSRWGTRIDYSLEESALSTIGPLTLIPNLPENFLVMNGDILCDLDYADFYRYHITQQNDVTVAVYKRSAKIDFGVLKYDSDNIATDFVEKPVYSFDVSMGVYCLSRSMVNELEKGKSYGFDRLMIDGIRNGKKIGVKPFEGFWLDLGRPEDFEAANERYSELKARLGLTT
jgi:NDP-mannose synthase